MELPRTLIPMQKHLAFLTSLLLLSCASKPNKEEAQNIDTFRSYQVDVFSPSSNLFEYIESIEVIGLEETDSSLLEMIRYLEVLDDKILLTSGNNGDFYLFTKEGELIKKINRTGQGPEEYSRIWDIWTNGDLIEVHDNGLSRIVSYDFAGNHVKSQKLPNLASHAVGYKEEYFLDMVGMLSTRNPESMSRHFVNTFDQDWAFKNSYIPNDQFKKAAIMWGYNSFTRSNGNLYYQSTFEDTVYVYRNGFEPLASIDFGDDWIWNDPEAFEDVNKQRAMMSQDKKVMMFFMNMSDEHIFFTTIAGHGAFLLNRQTGDYKRLDLTNKEGYSYLFNVWQWIDDKAVITARSQEVVDFVEGIGEENVTYVGDNTLEKIESSENQAILLVRFKTDLK